MKKIYCHIEKCLSCHSCELACAVAHSQSKDINSAIDENPLPKHYIRVEQVESGGNIVHVRSLALQCRHCEEPLCVQACISGGIRKNEDTGIIEINAARCVGCWSCIMVCPFGAIIRQVEQKKAAKCDRCAETGVPACVEACPTGALLFCEKQGFIPFIV